MSRDAGRRCPWWRRQKVNAGQQVSAGRCLLGRLTCSSRPGESARRYSHLLGRVLVLVLLLRVGILDLFAGLLVVVVLLLLGPGILDLGRDLQGPATVQA